MSGHHCTLAQCRQQVLSSIGQICERVSPDVHEVLVHAPGVLGGDWDGDPVLLQVRRHRAGVRLLRKGQARLP